MQDTFWGLSATGWTAIYTLLTAGLLALAFVAAFVASRQWKSGEMAREDARTAAQEASRPYVVVTLEPGLASPHILDVVIRNSGQRPALNTRIHATPPLATTNDMHGYSLADARLFTEPIAMLAPGQQIRVMFDSLFQRSQRQDTDNSLPTRHDLSVTYADSSGHPYSDAAVLDVEQYKGTLHTSVNTVHDLTKAVEKIHGTLRRAAILSSGTASVEATVESPTDREERIRREREEEVARVRARNAEHQALMDEVMGKVQPPASGTDTEDQSP